MHFKLYLQRYLYSGTDLSVDFGCLPQSKTFPNAISLAQSRGNGRISKISRLCGKLPGVAHAYTCSINIYGRLPSHAEIYGVHACQLLAMKLCSLNDSYYTNKKFLSSIYLHYKISVFQSY